MRENNFKERPKTKQKLVVTTYTKEFEDFNAGVTELINIADPIYNLLEETECAYGSVAGFIDAIVEIAHNNLPNPEEKKNLHFEYFISANKVEVKTNKFINFGFRTKLDRETKAITYVFSVGVAGTTGEIQEAALEALKAGEWTEVIPKFNK